MTLWWLGEPRRPRLIGRLALADGNRKVALEYAPAWLVSGAGGFALSEDLPLQRGVFTPAQKDTAVGAVDDARPDRWGERVIRLLDRPPRLSLLEFLYFAGDDRFGALGVSLSQHAYLPRKCGPIPSFAGLADMAVAIKKVLADESVSEAHRRLLQPGVSFGGMRPKSLMQIDGKQWVVKFSEGEAMDTPLLEHASMVLARRCGIRSAQTLVLPLSVGNAVAVSRFDRAKGKRIHAISANVAFRACGEAVGYPELAQLLRRLGRPDAFKAQQRELFRRMVFNILMDNTDDHEKNHALTRGDDGFYALSEAFDIVPAAQGLRYQQMRVGKAGAESTLGNAMSDAAAFGLLGDQPREIVREICRVVEGWKAHFRALGVCAADIEALAPYIDGDYLVTQRRALSR